MNITLDDLINDFPNEENTIIKLLYYEAKNYEQQNRHTLQLLDKSRTQVLEQQVVIDGLNSALAETTRQYEGLQSANSVNNIESYKRTINSLNDQINSLREMEQAYENEIISVNAANATLKSRLDDLEIEYQSLSVKYDSLMQNSILPMETVQ